MYRKENWDTIILQNTAPPLRHLIIIDTAFRPHKMISPNKDNDNSGNNN